MIDLAARGATELLPCPFCGEAAQVAGSLFFTDAISVECGNGHSNGWLYADRDEAVSAWNRRATPAALADAPEIAALIREAGTQELARIKADVDGWASNATEAWRLFRDAEADRDRLAAELAEARAQVEALRELRNFLGGTGLLEGVAFGDDHPTKKGRFWWREHLSKIDSLTVGSAALAAAEGAGT